MKSLLASLTNTSITKVLIYLLWTMCASAANTYTPILQDPLLEPWRWHSIPELEGQGFQCMCEGTDGAIWFGVNNGVMKYDGLTWSSFTAKDGVVGAPITSLCCAEDGTIYAGSQQGLSCYKNGSWQRIFPHHQGQTHQVWDIKSSNNGDIWASIRDGFMRINGDKVVILAVPDIIGRIKEQAPAAEVFRLPSKIVRNTSFNTRPNIIYVTAQNELWFTIDLGESRVPAKYNIQNGDYENQQLWHIFKNVSIPFDRYTMIYQIRNDDIFIVSNLKIVHYTNHTFNSFSLTDLTRIPHNDFITQTSDGRIWIGGISKFFIYEKKQWTILSSKDYPLPSGRLRLLETKDGNLWIGALGQDVERLDYNMQRWSTFKGLNYQCETVDGSKWFVSVDGGVVVNRNNQWIKYSSADGLIDKPFTLLHTRDGDIWAAGSDNGMGAVARFCDGAWHKKQLGCWGIDPRSPFEAKDGSLWFATSSDCDSMNGVFVFSTKTANMADKDNWTHYEHKVLWGYGIGQDEDEKIYVADDRRIMTFDNGHWSTIEEPAALYGSYSNILVSTDDGDIWIGSRGNGLFHKDPDFGWRNFTVDNGLKNNTISTVLVESDSSVWVVTDRDVSYFDGNSWTNNVLPDELNLNIVKENGILKTSNDNSMWINKVSMEWYRRAAQNSAVDQFDSSSFWTVRYKRDNNAPDTEITIADREISQPGNTTIFWDGKDRWEATSRENLQYSFRLNQNAWSPFTYDKYKVFFELPDGPYTFHVRARDLDFNVDETPAQFHFRVLPPLWKQVWFILLISTLFLSIAIFIVLLIKHNQFVHESDLMKIRLFTNISHELRTPLTLILGPLQKLIGSPDVAPSAQKQLKIMYRNADRLHRLINQILDFRKMESGNLKLELAKSDIIRFIRHISESFNNLADEKKIDFQFISAITSRETWFDPDKMDKVLFNLLSNAFKFTPKGGCIRIEVDVSEQKEKEFLHIRVSDTGSGISEKNLPFIFKRFYNISNPAISSQAGTGIGLALTEEYVKQHHGSIQVQSMPEKGSIFTVNLPLDANQFKKELKENAEYLFGEADDSKKEKQTKPDACGVKDDIILIVEDNEEMLDYITEEFKDEYRILKAYNGNDGLKTALEKIPDLIISDVMMPGLGGVELCRTLKTDPKTSHIPLILLTALSSGDDKIKGLEMGADDYVTKPFNARELKLRVRHFIEARNKLREKFSKRIQADSKELDVVSLDEKFMNQIINVIETHLSDPDFSVNELSSLMGMSRSQLFRKVKALTELTVIELVQSLRLKRAVQLLEKSGMNVTQVAFEVGFKNSSHFAKAFRKQYGQPPSRYIHKNE